MPSLNELKDMLSDENESQEEASESEASEDEESQTELKEIEVEGSSIDECLEKATEELGVSRMNIDYEVIQKGSKGFLGLFKKPFKLLITVTDETIPSTFSIKDEEENVEEVKEDLNAKKDGEIKVKIKKAGVFIKADPPRNEGKKATYDDALIALSTRNIKTYDVDTIKDVITNASGEWVKIGEWKPNPEYDSKAGLEITPDEMKAYVTVSAPILSGRTLDPEEIVSLLEANGVKFGINMEKIESMLEKEQFNIPILVAEGKPPQNGEEGKIDFKFKTDIGDVHYEADESGRVNFKEKDIVQNVVAGQVLAVKVPPTKGIPGRTITNQPIEASDGADIPFEPGKNTILSENGLEIIAQVAGQALFVENKINVEPVYEVSGDVNLETGNIVFLGTIVVKGNIEDGFSVKAAGDIEIYGSVGKAEVEADNNIIVKQGIMGKEEAIIKAGNNLYAKFIENAKVFVSNDVIVREQIIFSQVDAGGRVIVNGKRGYVLGGRIRVAQELNSKNIGAKAYTDTFIESGIDPKSKQKLQDLEEELTSCEEEIHKLTININTLKNLQESEGELSGEKQVIFERLLKLKKEKTELMQEISQDIEELKEYLNKLDSKGKVSAKNFVYPGVDITIKNANLRVKNDFKSVTFVNENGIIRPLPYQEVEGVEMEPESVANK